jgi:hypothetical protein
MKKKNIKTNYAKSLTIRLLSQNRQIVENECKKLNVSINYFVNYLIELFDSVSDKSSSDSSSNKSEVLKWM